MKKVKVETCYGTACIMPGVAGMMHVEERMPAEWRGKVEVEARMSASDKLPVDFLEEMACLGGC